jgi:hypothetical protein
LVVAPLSRGHVNGVKQAGEKVKDGAVKDVFNK